MKLLVKNCSVKRSGTVYGPSSVIELPDTDGRRLLETSPKNFEVIEEPKKTEPKKAAPKAEKVEAAEAEAKPASKRRRKKADADADALPDVNVEALVK